MNATAAIPTWIILLCLASMFCVYSLHLSYTKSVNALNAIETCDPNNNTDAKIFIDVDTSINTTSHNNTKEADNYDEAEEVFVADSTIAEDQATAIIEAAMKAANEENAYPKPEKGLSERNRIEAAAASETIADFDFSHPEIPCGSKKCYIPSKTLKSVGYLIGERSLLILQTTYEFGQHLQSRYGIPNILLGKPISIGYDSNLVNQIEQKSQSWMGNEMKMRFNKTLTIQKVRKVPFDDHENTFFVKWAGPKKNNYTRIMWQDLQRSLLNASSSGKERGWFSLKHGTIEKKDLFLRQFQKSINQVTLLMKNEPLFVYDLQFLVTSEGKIIHMDYDRVFDGWRRREILEGPLIFNSMVKKERGKCVDFLYEMKHDAVIDITNVAGR